MSPPPAAVRLRDTAASRTRRRPELRRRLLREADRVPAGRLRAVERAVGGANQELRRITRAQHGDAEARRDRPVGAVNVDALREIVAEMLRERGGAVDVGAGEDDREFLAADPRRQIRLTHAAADDIGGRAEHVVADLVAVAVVDLLEMV